MRILRSASISGFKEILLLTSEPTSLETVNSHQIHPMIVASFHLAVVTTTGIFKTQERKFCKVCTGRLETNSFCREV